MSINKALTELLGAGATQTIDTFTIAKASLKSKRVPIAFTPLVPLAENTAESLLASVLMVAWEEQDTSPDAEFAIFYNPATDVQLVSIVSDGVPTVFNQFVLTVRILNKLSVAQLAPNPNVI